MSAPHTASPPANCWNNKRETKRGSFGGTCRAERFCAHCRHMLPSSRPRHGGAGAKGSLPHFCAAVFTSLAKSPRCCAIAGACMGRETRPFPRTGAWSNDSGVNDPSHHLPIHLEVAAWRSTPQTRPRRHTLPKRKGTPPTLPPFRQFFINPHSR